MMMVLGFLSSVIMARILKSSGVGIFTVVTLVPAMAVSIISMGLDSANTYMIGRKKYVIKEVFSSCIPLILLLTILAKLDHYIK